MISEADSETRILEQPNFRRGDSPKRHGGEREDETEERVVQTGFIRVECVLGLCEAHREGEKEMRVSSCQGLQQATGAL